MSLGKIQAASDQLQSHFDRSEQEKSYIAPLKDVVQIMNRLITDSDLRQFFRLDSKGDARELSFSVENYQKKITPILIERIMDIFKTFQSEDVEKIKIYLAGDTDHPRFHHSFTFVQALEDQLKNRLVVAREMIHSIIPFAARQRLNIDYGFSSTTHVAIPFKATSDGNVPMTGCSYANPYNLMLLTMFCYLRRD